jgi:L-threonylcarbamoyladenylate synthase
MPGIRSISPSNLNEAVSLLRAGGVLLFPTETSYALGCDATNDAAVARIFAIKGRPEGKGTPLILPPDVDAGVYVELSDKAQALVAEHWPGPLNIVAKRVIDSPVSERCETDGTQSVRQSSHTAASELARLLGKPLVATSANKSGASAIYRPDEFGFDETGHRPVFTGEQPDALLDGGNLPVVPASTTIKVMDDQVEIIRQGSIAL